MEKGEISAACLSVASAKTFLSKTPKKVSKNFHQSKKSSTVLSLGQERMPLHKI
jgi:hypothetical protein